VECLSFKLLPVTTRYMHTVMKKNGNGTGVPGAGIQAVLAALISYPFKH